jgi:hypothetical protein
MPNKKAPKRNGLSQAELLSLENIVTRFVDNMRIKNHCDAESSTTTAEAVDFIDEVADWVGYYAE